MRPLLKWDVGHPDLLVVGLFEFDVRVSGTVGTCCHLRGLVNMLIVVLLIIVARVVP